MQKLNEKIVLITGASSGIGQACAEQFAALKANLIICARRVERINALAEKIKNAHGVKVLPISLDIQDHTMVQKILADLPEEWHPIDILVNNAGLALTTDKIQDADPKNWDIMINTNIKGLLYVTHAILPQMVTRKQGHIINIGSTAGHDCYPSGNIYCATKHAVRAISKSLRIDLLGTDVRVTEIDPGLVHTEFSDVRWNDKRRAAEFYARLNPLTADDIADAVVYSATRPQHVNVAEMVITPTDQASVHHINTKEENKGLFE